ncbi:MAG: hypothetical protein ACO4CT_16875 [Planctomycetota bacterium]
MSDSVGRKQTDVADRRAEDRRRNTAPVEVRFGDLQIVGEGGNRSVTGVYFVAEASAPVDVVVDGQVRRAELVRIENLGHGRLGVAVRFLDGPTGE